LYEAILSSLRGYKDIEGVFGWGVNPSKDNLLPYRVCLRNSRSRHIATKMERQVSMSEDPWKLLSGNSIEPEETLIMEVLTKAGGVVYRFSGIGRPNDWARL